MKDVSLFSKLGRRFGNLKEKSLTAHLLELSAAIVEQNYKKIALLIAEITESDAVVLKLKKDFYSCPLEPFDQNFLHRDARTKPGQHSKLGSALRTSLIGLGRSEINAFSSNDQILLDKIHKHISEDLSRQERYLEIVKDKATCFWSREVFFDFLEQEFGRSRRYQAPLSFVLIYIY